MKKVLPILTGLLLFLAGAAAAAGSAYDYPIDDPLAATILGTPKEFQADLPAKIPVKKRRIEIFANHLVPEPLWYEQGLRYSIARQDGPAPLVFVIAGTGAGYNSPKMKMLQKALYGGGFHVVCISSPTHPNFIATASSTSLPGVMEQDAMDLYRVLDRVWQREKDGMQVSGFLLTGYSLGAAESAFVARIDESRKLFNFKKVLLLNPPVNPYRSVKRLDAMLTDYATGGKDGLVTFFNDLMARFTAIYKEHDFVDFSEDLFYRIYQEKKAAHQAPDPDRMKAIIGLSFRMSSANMILAADLMTNSGYVVPKNLYLSSTDPLTDYWLVASRLSFVDYVDELLYEAQAKDKPGLTLDRLVMASSLKSIATYLTNAGKIGLITNADDVILDAADLEFFKKTFGNRATIYPNGGHCGNMAHRAYIQTVLDFLAAE